MSMYCRCFGWPPSWWPLVLKRTMQQEVERLNRVREHALSEAKKVNEKEKAILVRMLPTLARMEAGYGGLDDLRLQVNIRIDTELMHDKYYKEMIARELGHYVEHEISRSHILERAKRLQ